MPLHLIFRASDQRPTDLQDVHFHRGPQGRPIPCYDGLCRMPQMASQDIREAASVDGSVPLVRSAPG